MNDGDMNEVMPMDEMTTSQQQKEESEHHRQCVDELRTIFIEVNRYQQEPETYKNELAQLHTRGMLLCNKLRALNRAGRLRIQKARELTAEHRNRLDDHTLEQQNLLYELSHINKEIARCEEFKSKDEQLELVSLDDFYANAPAELTDPTITVNDPHRLHLFQLDWELMQREKLNDECKTLQNEIGDLKKQIVRRRKRLRSLRPKLKQVVKSTEPVRRYIETQFDETTNLAQSLNNPLIAKLPDPLYILYSLVLAYQQCDGRHITCQIDSKESVTLPHGLSSTTTGFNSITTIDTSTDSTTTNGEHQSLLRPHPLRVKVTLTLSSDHIAELIFTFLSQLNIVIVQVKLSGLKAVQNEKLTSILLHNLLDDDDNGELSPNPTTDFLFQQQGKSTPIFSDATGGYAYRWIQQLCKCQMIPLQRQESITDCSDIMKRLTQRMRARIVLDRTLVNLEKLEMPLLAEGGETSSLMTWFSRRSLTSSISIRAWRELTFDDVIKFDYIQPLIDERFLDRTNMAFYECRMQSSSQDENNKTTLLALVCIPANYPQARSLILLRVLAPSGAGNSKTAERTRLNNENIKIFERSLVSDVIFSSSTSIGSGLIDSSQHFTLFAQQIWRLSIGFTLFIDAESNLSCSTRRRQTLLSRLVD